MNYLVSPPRPSTSSYRWADAPDNADHVIWQPSQSGCDALNRLMCEAAQSTASSSSSSSSSPASALLSFARSPARVRTSNTRLPRSGSGSKPALAPAIASANRHGTVTPPSASMLDDDGDPTMLIDLIKVVSKKVDENSDLKRRFIERAQVRERSKDKEREKLLRLRETPFRSKTVGRLRRQFGSRGKGKENGKRMIHLTSSTSILRSSTPHEHGGGDMDKKTIDPMDLDGDRDKQMNAELGSISSLTNVSSSEVEMAPPTLPLPRNPPPSLPPTFLTSYVPSSPRSRLNHSRSLPSRSSQSNLTSSSNVRSTRSEHAFLHAGRTASTSKIMLIPQPHPINLHPVLKPQEPLRPESPHGQYPSQPPPTSRHGANNVIYIEANASLGSSQIPSQGAINTAYRKPPVLGMRRTCTVTRTAVPLLASQAQTASNLRPSQRSRQFKTPFAKQTQPPLAAKVSKAQTSPLMNTVGKLTTPDPTPQLRQGVAQTAPRQIQTRSRSGVLHAVVDKPDESYTPTAEADTSFGSVDFDLGIDAEELERACSAYD